MRGISIGENDQQTAGIKLAGEFIPLRLVYELYGLTGEEIEVVEGK